LLREQSALSGLPRGFFGNRLGGNFGSGQNPLLPRPSLSTSRYPVLWYEPLRVPYIPATGRRIWVCTLPLIEETGQSEPPGRHPPAPGSCIGRLTALPRHLYGFASGGSFGRLSPLPRAVRLRLSTGEPQIQAMLQLLSIAHAVVTRRRAEVCTLPLGPYRRSQSLPVAIHLHRAPIAV